MPLEGEYMGMPVFIDDLDRDNLSFYRYCGNNELRVQECSACHLKRLPPTSACPFCSSEEVEWVLVTGKGTVYSYGEVQHAIQGAFKPHLPYHLLLVELDEQKDLKTLETLFKGVCGYSKDCLLYTSDAADE